jgi:hypothetical protein
VFLIEPNCLSSIFSLIESINRSATKLSQVGVSDIGRKSVLISTDTVTFGIGITSASFHDVGRPLAGAKR